MKYPWSFSNSRLDRSLWIIINIIDRVDIDNIIGHCHNNQQKQAKMVIRRPRPSPRQGRRLGPPQVWNLTFLATGIPRPQQWLLMGVQACRPWPSTTTRSVRPARTSVPVLLRLHHPATLYSCNSPPSTNSSPSPLINAIILRSCHLHLTAPQNHNALPPNVSCLLYHLQTSSKTASSEAAHIDRNTAPLPGDVSHNSDAAAAPILEPLQPHHLLATLRWNKVNPSHISVSSTHLPPYIFTLPHAKSTLASPDLKSLASQISKLLVGSCSWPLPLNISLLLLPLLAESMRKSHWIQRRGGTCSQTKTLLSLLHHPRGQNLCFRAIPLTFFWLRTPASNPQNHFGRYCPC